jgi:hypothetical protein
MMKRILLVACIVLLLFSTATAAERKTEWTDPNSIQFAEDLFLLIEMPSMCRPCVGSLWILIPPGTGRGGSWSSDSPMVGS